MDYGKEEQFKTWKEVPTTNRGLEEYSRDLDLNQKTLEGKKILDVGSGTRKFAKEVKESGINAEVISLDPVYLSQELQEEKMRHEGGPINKLKEFIRATDIPDVKEKTVAGVGEKMPFKDETFDLILADNSLPAYGNKEQIDEFFTEAFRVLKKGGELRFTPSYTMFRRGIEYPLDKELDIIIKKIESDGKFTIIRKGSGQSLTILQKQSLTEMLRSVHLKQA